MSYGRGKCLYPAIDRRILQKSVKNEAKEQRRRLRELKRRGSGEWGVGGQNWK